MSSDQKCITSIINDFPDHWVEHLIYGTSNLCRWTSLPNARCWPIRIFNRSSKDRRCIIWERPSTRRFQMFDERRISRRKFECTPWAISTRVRVKQNYLRLRHVRPFRMRRRRKARSDSIWMRLPVGRSKLAPLPPNCHIDVRICLELRWVSSVAWTNTVFLGIKSFSFGIQMKRAEKKIRHFSLISSMFVWRVGPVVELLLLLGWSFDRWFDPFHSLLRSIGSIRRDSTQKPNKRGNESKDRFEGRTNRSGWQWRKFEDRWGLCQTRISWTWTEGRMEGRQRVFKCGFTNRMKESISTRIKDISWTEWHKHCW